MWCVRNIEFRSASPDFRSSGQGRYPATGVVADGVALVNAIDLVHLEGDPVQIRVCECCGVTGCRTGNWVCLRRFGDGLVVIPAFSAMEELQGSEHQPPDFITQRGAAFIAGSALRTLTAGAGVFRELDRWPQLTASEFVRVMQWEAPTRILGEFPAPPRVRRECVLALHPGDYDETIALLDDLLARAFGSSKPATLNRGEPVTFFLDLPGFVEWVPLALERGAALLANGPEWIVSFPDDE
jgi:hypothetical protein